MITEKLMIVFKDGLSRHFKCPSQSAQNESVHGEIQSNRKLTSQYNYCDQRECSNWHLWIRITTKGKLMEFLSKLSPLC